MRLWILFGLMMVGVIADNKLNFTISSQVDNTKSMKFIAHSGSGKYDNYLMLNVPFAPVEKVFLDLQTTLGKSLKNRGEAHITVITPPEYNNSLKGFVSMAEIDKIAIEMNIQSAEFEIVCIGSGKKMIDNKLEQTFYIVVTSKTLLDIRRKIQALYLEKGGDAKKFNADHYFPHITLGFTKRDLHESDGIIKDKKSFFAALTKVRNS